MIFSAQLDRLPTRTGVHQRQTTSIYVLRIPTWKRNLREKGLRKQVPSWYENGRVTVIHASRNLATDSPMSSIRTLAISCLIAAWAGYALLAQTKQVEYKPSATPLSKVVELNFARWDRDHDKSLDLFEVDHIIEDHNVRGSHAALAVAIRRKLAEDKDSNHPAITHDKLIKLVDTPDFAKNVASLTKHLETIDLELFLPKDPELSTFSQGKLNDCYLLSAIAAQVNRNPKFIREMIHPEVTGGFRVTFGDGQKIQVSPLTEGELLLGAKLDERHGSWLAVVEKAYGVIRKRDRAAKGEKPNAKTGTNDFEALNWGSSSVTIALITGHHTESLHLNKEPQVDKVHNLLIDLTKKRKLMCVGKSNDNCPPGIVGSHVYAILGYDANQKIVTVFNPWGNNFTPKGPSGKQHGWVTKNGHFAVPLDQFHAVFRDVVYETDKPLTK